MEISYQHLPLPFHFPLHIHSLAQLHWTQCTSFMDSVYLSTSNYYSNMLIDMWNVSRGLHWQCLKIYLNNSQIRTHSIFILVFQHQIRCCWCTYEIWFPTMHVMNWTIQLFFLYTNHFTYMCMCIHWHGGICTMNFTSLSIRMNSNKQIWCEVQQHTFLTLASGKICCL
jgi:hypothetical protein